MELKTRTHHQPEIIASTLSLSKNESMAPKLSVYNIFIPVIWSEAYFDTPVFICNMGHIGAVDSYETQFNDFLKW